MHKCSGKSDTVHAHAFVGFLGCMDLLWGHGLAHSEQPVRSTTKNDVHFDFKSRPGAQDRDGTVRARALVGFSSSMDLLWGHDLTGASAGEQHQSAAQTNQQQQQQQAQQKREANVSTIMAFVVPVISARSVSGHVVGMHGEGGSAVGCEWVCL